MSATRSRFCLVRSSLACARSRRFLKRPSPAASSTMARRASGVELSSASTLPWLMTLCISRPRPRPPTRSCTSSSRQTLPFSRYSEPLSRSETPGHLHLRAVEGKGAALVVEDQADLGHRARPPPVGTREDDVLHAAPPQVARALLSQHPEHGVGDVALAAAVGPDDDGDARLEEAVPWAWRRS